MPDDAKNRALSKRPSSPSEAPSTLTPKLRFPEFRKTEGWTEKTIGKISGNVIAGGTPSTSEKSYWNGDVRWMNSGELNLKKVYEVEGRITAEGLQNSSTKLIPLYCVLIGLAGQGRTRGTVAMNMVELCTNQSIAAIFPNESIFDSEFLYQNLNNRYDELRRLSANGEGRGGLNLQIIKSLKINLPELPEQQKIADCLTSLDEVIAAQGRKVEALKAHKKGLMQQLFPREGETLPRLRFPGFRDQPEWEEKKLEEIGRVIRGSSPRPQGDSRYYYGPVPRLMVQDVTRDGKWVTPRIDSLTEEGAKLSRPCPAGTLTIVCSGTVGVVSFLAVDACIHDGFLALIDIDESIATKDFLFHSLSRLREQFEKGATHGGVFTNLTTSSIKEFKINCPNLPEQAKIADCLSTLDDQIAAESEKLASLKTHKKGLMQQLFPSPEED